MDSLSTKARFPLPKPPLIVGLPGSEGIVSQENYYFNGSVQSSSAGGKNASPVKLLSPLFLLHLLRHIWQAFKTSELFPAKGHTKALFFPLPVAFIFRHLLIHLHKETCLSIVKKGHNPINEPFKFK